jgi:D-alanyl-D-alanine carboxypeptidase/D-alanyl-D-alanine-endopeptidase (penicillin-binding protein 4)
MSWALPAHADGERVPDFPPGEAWHGGLTEALATRALRGATVAILVVDRETGEVYFSQQADTPLIPASTQKLLTALGALETFGPDHRFVTELRAAAKPDEAGRIGDLFVVGGGDPSLTSEQWWRLAAELRAIGVTAVDGDLVLDDRAFDAEYWHPGWGPISGRAYHAPVSALTANYSAFRTIVAPGDAVGAQLRVSLDPPVERFDLEVRGSTGAPRKRSTLQVGRRATPEGEVVTVGGRLPIGAGRHDVYRSVTDPTAYAGGVFRMQLESVGIPVAGTVRRAQGPPPVRLILAHEGKPLQDVTVLFLKNSNNFIGENLVKSLGRRASGGTQPGSWTNGAEALASALRASGIDLGSAVLEDGSGLSRGNRVTARLLVDVLRTADRSFGVGPELLAGLPVSGRDGTLRNRARRVKGRVRAKTGTLNGVSALAGFARTEAGRDLAFAILVNDSRGGARSGIDLVITALVQDDLLPLSGVPSGPSAGPQEQPIPPSPQ